MRRKANIINIGGTCVHASASLGGVRDANRAKNRIIWHRTSFCLSRPCARYGKLGDQAFARMDKVNSDLLALTYGALVRPAPPVAVSTLRSIRPSNVALGRSLDWGEDVFDLGRVQEWRLTLADDGHTRALAACLA